MSLSLSLSCTAAQSSPPFELCHGHSRPPVSVSVTTSRVSSSGELSTFHRHRNVFHPAAHFHLLGSITQLGMHRLQLNASWNGAFMLLNFSSNTSNTCSGPYAAASTTAKMALWCLAASASGHVLVDLWRRYTSHPHSRSLCVHLCIFKNICTCHLNHSSLDGDYFSALSSF